MPDPNITEPLEQTKAAEAEKADKAPEPEAQSPHVKIFDLGSMVQQAMGQHAASSIQTQAEALKQQQDHMRVMVAQQILACSQHGESFRRSFHSKVVDAANTILFAFLAGDPLPIGSKGTSFLTNEDDDIDD